MKSTVNSHNISNSLLNNEQPNTSTSSPSKIQIRKSTPKSYGLFDDIDRIHVLNLGHNTTLVLLNPRIYTQKFRQEKDLNQQ